MEGESMCFRTKLMEEVVCPVCLDTIHGASTLSCGHSGCLLCLSRSLYMSGGQCPSCRAFHREPLAFNITLCNIVSQLLHGSNPKANSEQEKLFQPHPLLPSEEEQAAEMRDAVDMDEKATVLNMLKAGYDPNSRLPECGSNALARSVRLNSRKMVKIIIGIGGAHVDLQDADGDTALMNAVYFRHPSMVRMLLTQYKANPHLLSETGLTALDYAHRPGHEDACVDQGIVDLLEEAVATWVEDSSRGKAPPFVERAPGGSSEMEDIYDIEQFENNGTTMRVMVAAPMARSDMRPTSVAVGRLAQGDTVFVTAYAVRRRTQICYVQFEQGPSHCAEGWLPFYLPTSNTRVLDDRSFVSSSQSDVEIDMEGS